jgi:hypothetical protein
MNGMQRRRFVASAKVQDTHFPEFSGELKSDAEKGLSMPPPLAIIFADSFAIAVRHRILNANALDRRPNAGPLHADAEHQCGRC